MSAGILLIDGYNLMHAAGMAQRDYKPGELFKCRTKLLRFLLGKLSAAEVREATVVFDARDPPPDRPAQVVISGLKVLFANPGGDADVLIQQWLARHPSPGRVTLVSSDRVLQRAARSCSSKFFGSDEFMHDLERRRAPRGRVASSGPRLSDESKPVGHLSAAQTAYWLKIFGDVPVVIADEAKAASPPHGTTSQPKSAARLMPPVSSSRKSRSQDSKSVEKVPDEATYWLQVFGETPTGPNDSSPEELRLADLENWLREFQAGNS